MWSSVVVSLQLEKGGGSRSGMVTISYWPKLREPYSPPPCQAGCGAPWPGSVALLPREREQSGAAEVLRWSGSSIGLSLRSNQGGQSPCPPASSPARPVCPLSPTDSLHRSLIKITGKAKSYYLQCTETQIEPHSQQFRDSYLEKLN